MAQGKDTWDDRKIGEILGRMLQAGVLLAAAFVFFGGIAYLWRYGADLPQYRIFHGEPSDLRSVSGILHEAFSFRSKGLIQFGLLTLIIIPMARVVFSVYAFAREHDVLYTAVSFVVLALLIASFTAELF